MWNFEVNDFPMFHKNKTYNKQQPFVLPKIQQYRTQFPTQIMEYDQFVFLANL